VPIEFLKANPRNPRRHFSEAELGELAGSIRERGIIQPIVVRTVRGTSDSFEIIAGERRWRAAQRAGLHEVPIIVHEASDAEALELAIIENVQRTDLNALEEALGYQALADEYKYTQEDIAKTVGKSRSHVANTLRLLKLPEAVKAYINVGKLTAGHARALIGLPDPEAVAHEIVARDLNVRAVEQIAHERATAAGKAKKKRERQVSRRRAITAVAIRARSATASASAGRRRASSEASANCAMIRSSRAAVHADTAVSTSDLRRKCRPGIALAIASPTLAPPSTASRARCSCATWRSAAPTMTPG
jgi:ParB/RepB/Spo0J family partition protein